MNYRLVTPPAKSNYLRNLLTWKGVEDIDGFLSPRREFLQSPDALCNIEEGAAALESILNSAPARKILLVVDCDVDGFTSSAILYQFLKEVNNDIQIDYYLHEHKEHGLEDVLRNYSFTDHDYGLVIVPDAGTNDYEYIEQLQQYHDFVLVLDHHLKDSKTQISNNCIIINNQMSDDYKNKDLTGAGVVWQFCRYYDHKYNGDAVFLGNTIKYCDLAALGIISDMGSYMSLENRYIINTGLKNIENYFFKTACEKQSYAMNNRIDYMGVAFYITPLLNSMIRVGTQGEKERLFWAFIDGHKKVPCHKRGAAKGILEEVAIESLRECTNTKSHQDKIVDAAVNQLNIKIFNNNLLDNKILFVELDDEDDFPQDVNGLICMRLSAEYKRPTLIGRRGTDNKIRGSVRGLNNSELKSTRDFLLSSSLFDYCSGHDNAFGFGISAGRVDNLLKYANATLSTYDFNENFYEVDFSCDAADPSLINIISEVGSVPEIFGQNIKEPLFHIGGLKVPKKDFNIIGSRKDTVRFTKYGVTYIKFHANDLIDELETFYWADTLCVEVIGKANLNKWNGNITPQIVIENYEIQDDTYVF